MLHTEKEARTMRAFADCGRSLVVNVFDRDGKVCETYSARRCIASKCIAWIWQDAENERWISPGKDNGEDRPKEWTAHIRGPHYPKNEADRPEGATGFTHAFPYMQHCDKHRDLGWWHRPNPNRLGRCGRLLSTTLLERD